jgi:hypothetical protein
VKNKAPAEVQITAEQLLREAKERELELLPPPPQQKITDEEELNDYKLRKRKVSPSECTVQPVPVAAHSGNELPESLCDGTSGEYWELFNPRILWKLYGKFYKLLST